jgi:hypothetical protein
LIFKYLIIALAFFCSPTFSQRTSTPDKRDPTLVYVEHNKKEELAPAALKACLEIDEFVTEIHTYGIKDSILFGTYGTFKCRYSSDTPERPSALQQRVLQTRRFIARNINDVYWGIFQWAEDRAFKTSGRGLLRTAFIHPKTGFRIEAAFDGAEVRIRTFERQFDRQGDERMVEVFNKQLYQKIFDSFAQHPSLQRVVVEGVESATPKSFIDGAGSAVPTGGIN